MPETIYDQWLDNQTEYDVQTERDQLDKDPQGLDFADLSRYKAESQEFGRQRSQQDIIDNYNIKEAQFSLDKAYNAVSVADIEDTLDTGELNDTQLAAKINRIRPRELSDSRKDALLKIALDDIAQEYGTTANHLYPIVENIRNDEANYMEDGGVLRDGGIDGLVTEYYTEILNSANTNSELDEDFDEIKNRIKQKLKETLSYMKV